MQNYGLKFHEQRSKLEERLSKFDVVTQEDIRNVDNDKTLKKYRVNIWAVKILKKLFHFKVHIRPSL